MSRQREAKRTSRASVGEGKRRRLSAGGGGGGTAAAEFFSTETKKGQLNDNTQKI